ncbi:MAG: hypothetical protein AAGB11_14630, partial [Pseudomonadota bacterium]
ASGKARQGVVAGFHGPTSRPLLDDETVLWTSDETNLARSDIDAFVIQDCRLLSDITLSLTVGRPTLFVVGDPVDLIHLSILQANREVILTPYDAVYAPAGMLASEGLRDHEIGRPDNWIAAKGRMAAAPETLAPFNAISKAAFRKIARQVADIELPKVQHFWRLVGEHANMAQTVMATPRMIRTGVGGPFNKISPTIIFADPARVDQLGALTLRQSTIILALFANPIGEAVDAMLTGFVDARQEPFLLHDVVTFGDVRNATIGCLFGEYLI